MSYFNAQNQPHRSLKEKGLEQHFKDLGLDYTTFERMVENGVSNASIRRFFRYPNGTMRSRVTISHWVELYKAGKAD